MVVAILTKINKPRNVREIAPTTIVDYVRRIRYNLRHIYIISFHLLLSDITIDFNIVEPGT